MRRFEYNITPVPKPRMTRRDKWAKRPCVVNYFAFRDFAKILKIAVAPCGDTVFFVMPMPAGWSQKKRKAMDGQPHTGQDPDIDNLLKGLLDAVYGEDNEVWHVQAVKLWGQQGQIIVFSGGAGAVPSLHDSGGTR